MIVFARRPGSLSVYVSSKLINILVHQSNSVYLFSFFPNSRSLLKLAFSIQYLILPPSSSTPSWLHSTWMLSLNHFSSQIPMHKELYPAIEPFNPNLRASGKVVLITGVDGTLGGVSIIPSHAIFFYFPLYK